MKSRSILALVASISLFQGSLTYTLRHHHHHHYHVRSWQPDVTRHLEQREEAGAAKISTGQLQQLQQRVETYNFWLTHYTESHPGGASGPFQQNFQAFEGLVNGWVQASTDIDTALLAQLEQQVQAYNQSVSTFIATRPPNEDGTVQLHQQYQAFSGWIEDWLATSTGTSPKDNYPEPVSSTPSPKESGSTITSTGDSEENNAAVPDKSETPPPKSDSAPIKSDSAPVKSESAPVRSDSAPVKSDSKPDKDDSDSDTTPEISNKNSENTNTYPSNVGQSSSGSETQTPSPPVSF